MVRVTDVMERLNLARSQAGTSVCSSAVSYSLTPLANLLAGLDWMTETFIKPPVTLTLHLPLPVKLARLEWSTRVGSQSSLSHEVHVSTAPEALAGDGGGCDCGQGPSYSLYKVGFGTAGAAGRIVFTNRRCEGHSEGFRLHSRENLSAMDTVTAVVIKITRTLSSSVPCLSNLKIVGLSSGQQQYRLAEERLVSSIQSAASGGSSQGNTVTYFGGEEEVEESLVGETEAEYRAGGEEQEIPAEFLDSITHSLMSLPMTLPSGHLVDRSTVERCEDMFRARGAQPRDPFTGKLLSESYKPTFNAALKSRIDRFVLTRRELLPGGQTLGGARAIQEFLSMKQDPARIGEKRKLNCDNSSNTNLGRESSRDAGSVPDHEDSDEDRDNTDLNQALQRILSKRKKIIKS